MAYLAFTSSWYAETHLGQRALSPRHISLKILEGIKYGRKLDTPVDLRCCWTVLRTGCLGEVSNTWSIYLNRQIKHPYVNIGNLKRGCKIWQQIYWWNIRMQHQNQWFDLMSWQWLYGNIIGSIRASEDSLPTLRYMFSWNKVELLIL